MSLSILSGFVLKRFIATGSVYGLNCLYVCQLAIVWVIIISNAFFSHCSSGSVFACAIFILPAGMWCDIRPFYACFYFVRLRLCCFIPVA